MKNKLIYLATFLALGIGFSGCNSSSSSDNTMVSIVGELNESFAGTGYVVNDNAAGGSDYDYGEKIAIDNDGNIYVTGYSNNGSDDDMVIWKYKNDGTLDTSFDNDGIVVYDSTENDNANSIAIDSDGNIYVAGSSYNGSNDDMVIWKYKNDGTLDTSFDNDGIVVYDSGSLDAPKDIRLDTNGNIYLAGTSWSSDYDMVILKYKNNGTLDTSFDSDGIVVYDGGSYDIGYGIVLDNSENIYFTGASYNGSNYDIIILKYKNDGTLDESFDSDGIVVYNSSAADGPKDIILDTNENIYVVGYSNNGTNQDMLILKYKNDGTLDTSFDSDGIVVHDNAAGGSGDDFAFGITLDSSGYIYVSGRSNNGSDDDMVIWNYK